MPTVLKSASLKLLEPSGSVQACNRITLPFRVQWRYIFTHSSIVIRWRRMVSVTPRPLNTLAPAGYETTTPRSSSCSQTQRRFGTSRFGALAKSQNAPTHLGSVEELMSVSGSVSETSSCFRERRTVSSDQNPSNSKYGSNVPCQNPLELTCGLNTSRTKC